jgi:hypothetical protein
METEARLVSRSHNNSCNGEIQQQPPQLLNLYQNLHPNNSAGPNFLSTSQLDRTTDSINTQQQFQRVYSQDLAPSATSLEDKLVYSSTPVSTLDYYISTSDDPLSELSRFPVSALTLPHGQICHIDDSNFWAAPSSVRSSEWTTYQATPKQMAIAPRTPPESSSHYANASGVEYMKDYWADMLQSMVSVDANSHSQQLMYPPLAN